MEGWATKVSCANPCPVIDRQTGDIWVFWGVRTKKKPRGLKSEGVHYAHSSDDGVTWSKTQPLKVDGELCLGLPTTCRGIQLSTGRLLLPYYAKHSRSGHIPRTIYSDDHGKTWKLGNESPTPEGWKHVSSSEYCLLELADGRVYMNKRRSTHRVRGRAISFSEDGGLTWSNPGEAMDLTQPINGCHSGLIRLTHPKRDDKSRVLYSSPWGGVKKKFGRRSLTVQISYDECKSWTPLKVIKQGNTSYSNLIVLPDKSIGCIYEFNSKQPKVWQSIRFARFTLEWLTDGKDTIEVKKITPPSEK
jgi:sialidase-1